MNTCEAPPVTSPVKSPTKEVAVTTPETLASPETVNADSGPVLPIPTLETVLIPTSVVLQTESNALADAVALMVTFPVVAERETLLPATSSLTTLEVNVAPSPRRVYNSSKLEFIFRAPASKLSPLPSFGLDPVPIPCTAIIAKDFKSI